MRLYQLLFPTLKDRRWGYVNFGEEAFVYKADPELSYDWIFKIYQSMNIEFSYGGYMEDRSFLMRNQYQKPGETWHLGIDFTVPAGTPVHLPVDAVLRSSCVDPDQNGGWGGKAIFETRLGYLILGHLNEIEPKNEYKAGDLIGTIAEFDKNGGWFPHLHVQAVSLRYTQSDPEVIDGYSSLYTGIEKDCPRPDCFIQELLK